MSMDVRSGVLIYFLPLMLVVVSIARFPFLDETPELKIVAFCAEFITAIVLLRVLPQRVSAIKMVLIIVVFVCFRLVYGFVFADFYFQQTVAQSLKESRFGFMLIAWPLVYYFLKDVKASDLKKIIVIYLLAMVVLDVSVLANLATKNLLVLGGRTDYRFVISVMIPSVCLILLVIREQGKKSCESFAILASIMMLLHTTLVTTSRIDTLIVAGTIGFLIQRRWPCTRWWLYAMVIAAVAYLGCVTYYSDESVLVDRHQIAGRDFPLAFDVSMSGLPWGYGTVIDTIAKRELYLPNGFYFSDYGLLLYVMRYGLLGIMMASLLLIFWLRFTLASWRLKGIMFLSVPILVFLMFVPFLDYGSFNGAFLLASMMLISRNCKKMAPHGFN